MLILNWTGKGYGKTVKSEILKPATQVVNGVENSNDLLSLSKKLKVSGYVVMFPCFAILMLPR